MLMGRLPLLTWLIYSTSLGVAYGQTLNSYDTRGMATSSATDSDGDGLSDSEETLLGSDPVVADTDGDALLDGWEVNGVNGIDLAALGASARHKDIFVEMDFMVRASATNGLGPNAAVLDAIREAFATAPVANPDGSTGINIHLIEGEEVPHDPELFPAGEEFLALKATHFDPARLPVFHYMIWADTYKTFGPLGEEITTSSGNAFDIPNSDLIVTLGAWNEGAGGTDEEKIGTFIHELGHDLGLRHGGSDNEGYKPNHISVMNYRWQTTGVIVSGNFAFEFQRFQIGALNENALDEGAGLTSSSDLANYFTAWVDPAGNVVGAPAGGAIDWDQDGAIDTASVGVDINGNDRRSTLTATPDEWLSIIYNGGAIGGTLDLAGLALVQNSRSREVTIPELTEEEADVTRLLSPQ
jgi:Bacterial TSP3 repeat